MTWLKLLVNPLTQSQNDLSSIFTDYIYTYMWLLYQKIQSVCVTHAKKRKSFDPFTYCVWVHLRQFHSDFTECNQHIYVYKISLCSLYSVVFIAIHYISYANNYMHLCRNSREGIARGEINKSRLIHTAYCNSYACEYNYMYVYRVVILYQKIINYVHVVLL